MILFLRPWFIATMLLLSVAIVAGIAFIRDSSAQFVTPTSGMYAAVDCDIAAAGVQDECSLPANATSVTVAVVMGNADTPTSAISAIQFDVLANQRILEPRAGTDADKNANPDFEDATFTFGTWSCTPPPPSRDTNPDPLIADSFLSCYQSVYGRGEPFNAGAALRVARVNYDIARTGTAEISLHQLSAGDNDGLEVMTCNPGGEVPTQCFGARIHVGVTPTATATSTATPPPGSTVAPSATPTPTIGVDPTVTPTMTSVPTEIPTPVLDTDMDGVLDAYELVHPCMTIGVADGQADPDADGLSNASEAALTTNACNADSDTDTMPDGFEVVNDCLDPLAPAAPTDDRDADTLTDVREYEERTLPCAADSDRDGYDDGVEIALGEDPLLYCTVMRADVNYDRRITSIDLSQVAKNFGTTPPGNPRMDQGNDGRVSAIDLRQVAILFGRTVQSCE